MIKLHLPGSESIIFKFLSKRRLYHQQFLHHLRTMILFLQMMAFLVMKYLSGMEQLSSARGVQSIWVPVSHRPLQLLWNQRRLQITLKRGEPGLKEQDPGPIMEWSTVSCIFWVSKQSFKIAKTGRGTWVRRPKVWIVMTLHVKWIRTGLEDESARHHHLCLLVAQFLQFWFFIQNKSITLI